jgi:threonine dehydrogenase-like Zn-dependent dehydrogenase
VKAVAVFPTQHNIRLIDLPEPQISRPDQVKLRMLEVGVCGTDKDIAAFAYGSSPPGSDHFILGHESLAEVAAVGDQVRDMRAGDLVVSSVRLPCSEAACLPCRAHHQDFCVTGNYREHGIKDLDGFMAEYAIEERRYLHPVPRELREVAVLVEPLTIAEKAIEQVRQIQQRLPWGRYQHRAVVLGAGPVGLLGAMLLVNSGFETFVYSRGRTPNPKAAIAEAIGARYISSEATPLDMMAKQVGDIGVVYEAVGASQFAFEVLKYLGPNGIFVFTGVPRGEKPVQFDTERIMMNLVLRNQVVLGTVNAGQSAFESAVRDLGVFASRWPQAVRGLITHRFPIEAFHDPVNGKAGGIKNVIVISQDGRP